MTKKRIVIVLFLILIISVGGVVAYALANGELWKEVALNAINDNISTNMEVEDVEVNILASFPQISVDLNNIRISGVPSRKGVDSDTLLAINKLSVAFSMWDVVFGEPVIRSLYLNDGALLIEKFPSGNWNYDIGTNNSDSSGVEITSIHLNNIDVTFIEKGQKVSTALINSAEIGEQWLSCSFEDFKYDGISDVFIPLYGEFQTSFSENEKGGYKGVIDDGVLAGLGVSCEYVWSEKGGFDAWGHFSNVSQDGLGLVFNDKESFDGWTYGGKTNLYFNTDSKSGRIDFNLPKADFAVSPGLTGLVLNNKGSVSGKGRIDLDYTLDKIGFSLREFLVNSNGLEVELEGSTSAWGSKPVDFDIKAKLDLGSSYLSWVPKVSPEIESVMPNQGSISISTLVAMHPSGEFSSSMLQAESSSIKGLLNSSPYTLSNVLIDYSKGLIKVNDLNFNWAGNVGSLTCRINSLDDALEGGPVLGSIEVDAESVLVDPIFSWWENRPDSEEMPDQLSLLPNGSSLNYTVKSDLLIWGGLECKEYSSKGEIGTKTMRISYLKTKSLDGEATLSGQLKTLNNNYTLGLVGSAEGFVISDLFRVYENFGQNFLRAEHMEGRADISGNMNLVWDYEGNWVSNAFDAEMQASITNGRLKNLEVFDDVADYLKENRLIAPLVDPEDLRERLSDIDFDYVETPVSVSMSSVSIPFTNIHSSAMNVSLEGSQTYEGGINYTLGFALRDLKDDKQGVFGDIQDDGLGNMFFLGMDGTLEEPIYSYDRKAHKEHRKRLISAEAQRIKDALTKDGDDESTPVDNEKSSKQKNSRVLDDPEDDDF